MWSIEEIPDKDSLYYRIHRTFIREGEILPSAFREIRGGMSTDWDKYSTPEESLSRARSRNDNGIVSFMVYNLRIDLNLHIQHSPTDGNISHTNITGLDEEARLKMLDIYEWKIEILPT